ncbi:MAG: hypothetical protein OES32_16490 [Acidobacteriota bacterium]|nr:hypothetical protein [Acidobacteriota bacterium]MDH3525177.1 hypothetical protein [Acidobacteriota bacterium]
MTSAIDALGLERIDLAHAGSESYPMHPKVRAVAGAELLADLEPIG